MPKVSTTIRTDLAAKQQVQQIFSNLGMDMSTAVNIFFHQVIRSNGLPFQVVTDVPNSETLEAMKEIQCMKENPSMGKSYTDVDSMMKDLLS